MEQNNSDVASQGYEDDRNLFLFDSNHKSLKYFNSLIAGLRDYLPIISILILFCSLLKLNWYYKFFNINILNYITFSELIAPILIDLASIVIAFIMLVLIAITFMQTNFRLNKFIKERQKKKDYFLLKNKKLDLISMMVFFLTTLFASITIVFWLILQAKSVVNLRYLVYLFAGWMISQILFILIHQIFKIKIHIIHYYLLFTVFTFIIGSIVEGWSTASAFYDNKNFHTSSVIFENDTLLASSSNFLVGLTNDYVMIWDDQNGRSEVRRKSDIKSIYPGFLPIPSLSVIYFPTDSLNQKK